MSRLAPDLFQRRFQDLMEIGRAHLPSLAPEWTDHNAHDPGITLMELLAWVTEAQLYSLSRLRRDERASYAALLGIGPAGTRGASGLIWPDRLDPSSPNVVSTKSVVIPDDTVINVTDSENPTFRPLKTLLWVPGRIETLETRGSNGRVTDHTAMNERGNLPFLPFGEQTGRGDVLALTFECRDKSGLFGSNRAMAKGALWSIGILVAPPPARTVEPATAAQTDCSPLSATLVTDDDRIEIRVAADSTLGLFTTGVLMLDLESVKASPTKFTIELRCRSGFPRPPHVLRIAPNVLPILQGRTILRESSASRGLPDWTLKLEESGLRFASEDEPVTVEIVEPAGLNTWRRCGRLSDHGPHDNVYELETRKGEILFGNGVNGRIPPGAAPVFVSYSVSDGEEGRVARNRKWKVAGFAGTFGVNLHPITGGADSSEWIAERRAARRRSRDDHALVSADDIISAAKALPLLEVARAWLPLPDAHAPRTGVVTLVAMRARSAGKDPEQPPETTQWLQTIRRRLAPRLPLGSRLVVTAPHYVEFTIQAIVVADAGTNPPVIKEAVDKELRKRLALVDPAPGMPLRQPGISVTRRDVAAWVRATHGVRQIIGLALLSADGTSTETIAVQRNGLPRWNQARSTIEVRRPETGRPR